MNKVFDSYYSLFKYSHDNDNGWNTSRNLKTNFKDRVEACFSNSNDTNDCNDKGSLEKAVNIITTLFIPKMMLVIFITIIDVICSYLRRLFTPEAKERSAVDYFYYFFQGILTICYVLIEEIKWFLASMLNLRNYEAKFYIYAAILTLSAITVMALNTAGIISLSMTAGIAMHAAAALLLLSMIFKAAYKVYNGEKKHLLTTAALTVGLATMALSIVHIYDIAVINELQAIVTHPAALIAPLAIMAIAAVAVSVLNAYKKCDSTYIIVDPCDTPITRKLREKQENIRGIIGSFSSDCDVGSDSSCWGYDSDSSDNDLQVYR